MLCSRSIATRPEIRLGLRRPMAEPSDGRVRLTVAAVAIWCHLVASLDAQSLAEAAARAAARREAVQTPSPAYTNADLNQPIATGARRPPPPDATALEGLASAVRESRRFPPLPAVRSVALVPARDTSRLDTSTGEERIVAAMAQPTVTAAPRDRKSTRLNSSHIQKSRMPSSA